MIDKLCIAFIVMCFFVAGLVIEWTLGWKLGWTLGEAFGKGSEDE